MIPQRAYVEVRSKSNVEGDMLMFCTRKGNQLSQSNLVRRHFHPGLDEIGFEKTGNHAFRRFRDRFVRNGTGCPKRILHFWLDWGDAGMSGHYDQIKNDVTFRKDVANRCGIGFRIPASLASIEPNEPNEPKFEAAAETIVAVTV
jgi:hypothetical protein